MYTKLTIFLSDFLDRFRKKFQISNFMKIRPVGTELFRADGQTDSHGEANRHFSQLYELS